MDHTASHDLPSGAFSTQRLQLPPLAVVIAATLGVAAIAAFVIIAAAGMRTEVSGFLRFVLLAAAMLILSGWCWHRYPDKRLAHAAGVVGVGTVALLLCGIISNAGLRLGAPLADQALAAADASMGLHVDQIVRAMAQQPSLIDGLAWLYNASGILVVGLIALSLILNAAAKAWELAGTAVISMQVVALLSIAMPAIGAMTHLGMGDLQGAGLPAGAGVYHLQAFFHFRNGPDVLRLADLNGLVTFPSFHTILALLATQALWDTRLRWPGVAWTAGVIVSTIPIGGHYVVDLIAGFIVWLAAAIIVRRISIPSA